MVISASSAYSVVELVTTTQLPIKLSSSNYLTWYKQVTLFLTANNVLGYVFGTLLCPPATLELVTQLLKILLLLPGSVRIIMCF